MCRQCQKECKTAQRLLVTNRETDESYLRGKGVPPYDEAIEATLTANGDQTILVIEVRGMPLDKIAFYGTGWQIHAEDLAAYLAGRAPGGPRGAVGRARPGVSGPGGQPRLVRQPLVAGPAERVRRQGFEPRNTTVSHCYWVPVSDEVAGKSPTLMPTTTVW